MIPLKPVSDRDYLQTLYLLKLIQTGSHEAARAQTRFEIRQWRDNAGAGARGEPGEDLLRRSIDLPAAAPVTPGDLGGWPLRLHHLPEPERSVLTLFYADLLPASTLCRLFKLELPALAERVAQGRRELGFVMAGSQRNGVPTPVTGTFAPPGYCQGAAPPEATPREEPAADLAIRSEEPLRLFDKPITEALQAHRPDHAYLDDAVRLIEPTAPAAGPVPGTPAGNAPPPVNGADSTQARQCRPAKPAPEREGATATSTGEGDEEDEPEEPPRRARFITILVAIGVGLGGTIAIAWFMISEQIGTFTGAERVSELLDSANNLNGDEFEPVNTPAKNLEDYFFLKHGLEHYAVPKELADLPAVGCRVVKFDGVNVAEIMADGSREMLLFLFPPEDLGVKVRPGRWEIIQGENWVGGLNGDKDVCCLVSFQGTRDDMKAFLKAAKR